MDAFKTHGAFSWSELMTPDPAAATAFYGALLGWKIDTMEMGNGPYHVVKAGDAAVGGIMKTPADAAGMPPSWGVYMTVDDVEAAVAKAQALGGKVVAPVMAVPHVGRMAVLADPQGAVFSVMQYDPM
jgi:uncharacterized protein